MGERRGGVKIWGGGEKKKETGMDKVLHGAVLWLRSDLTVDWNNGYRQK